MDPNFIHLDWERSFDAIMLVALVAIIIERALSVIFQSRIYIEYIHKDGLKEVIAVAVSIAVCVYWQLDAVGMIILTETTTIPGYIVTGALVAGGSKGSVRLFQDFFNLQSTAFRMRHTLQAAKAAADVEEAKKAVVSASSKQGGEIAFRRAKAANERVRKAVLKGESAGQPVLPSVIRSAKEALDDAEAAVESQPED